MTGSIALLTDEGLRATILEDNPAARIAFMEALGPEVEAVVTSATLTWHKVDRLNQITIHGPLYRQAQVRLFLHAAFDSLVGGTNLLVGGFPLAGGGQMRHFGESVAMALLCLDPASQVFENLMKLGTKYPAHRAVDKLKNKKQWSRIVALLDAPEDGWDTFSSIAELWDHFSHGGAFSLGFRFKFAVDGALVLGAEFDPDKIDQFRQDLRWRRSAFDVLGQIVDAVTPLIEAGKVLDGGDFSGVVADD